MVNVVEKLSESQIRIVHEETYNSKNKATYLAWFEDLKNKGTITENSNFEDIRWVITDTLQNQTLNFKLDDISFRKQKKERKFEFEISDLENALKFFFLIKLKTMDITTVYNYLMVVKSGFKKTEFYNMEKIKSFRREQKRDNKNLSYKRTAIYTIEFLEFFDIMNIDDRYYDLLESWLEIEENRNSRNLPTFTSYFKFQDKIAEFMEDLIIGTCEVEPQYSTNDIEAIKSKYLTDDINLLKIKYYPIILWWHITSWMPMRTTEFTITPYDCISYKDGKYMLTVMKSIEKGRDGEDEASHNIEDSFTPKIVEVNKDIFNLINRYRSIVDKYDDIENFYGDGIGSAGRRKYLLSPRGQMSCIPEYVRPAIIKKTGIIDYLSAHKLNNLLKSFYKDVLEGAFKMVVYAKGTKKFIGVNEIDRMQCMDTRHFSIMNLLMQDVSPIIVKELAAHRTIETTYSYCNHIESYIENYTYHLAQRYAKRDVSKSSISVINLNLSPTTSNTKTMYYREKIKTNSIKYSDVENGWCIYDKEDFNVCREYEFQCANGCKFYIGKDDTINENVASNKNKIKRAVEIIQELIKNRKTIKDFEVKYKTELSKIKSCAEQNAAIINRHLIQK